MAALAHAGYYNGTIFHRGACRAAQTLCCLLLFSVIASPPVAVFLRCLIFGYV